jgi:hypothetical protein
MERFIAWDLFQESAVRSSVAGKKPVSAVLRKLYALDRREERASRDADAFVSSRGIRKGRKHFSLSGSRAFSPSSRSGTTGGSRARRRETPRAKSERGAARLFESVEETGSDGASGEARDLSFVYAATGVSRRARAFRPAWQRPQLPKLKYRYVIFYPEPSRIFAITGKSSETPEITLYPYGTPTRQRRVVTSTRRPKRASRDRDRNRNPHRGRNEARGHRDHVPNVEDVRRTCS